MVSDLRCYIVRAEVRDGETSGTARISVITTDRADAISKARHHVRSVDGRRITKVVSARLSEAFRKKEAHA
jgi:hypothetical protein